MTPRRFGRVSASAMALLCLITSDPTAAQSTTADPRLREVRYDPRAVVTVPTRRGEVTLIVLAADESITELAAGLGSDCARPEAAWCIAAQPGGRHVFAKPKSSAQAPNNLALVTDKRMHAIRLTVLPDGDPKPSVYRLTILPPAVRLPGQGPADALAPPGDPLVAALGGSPSLLPSLQAGRNLGKVLQERLQSRPQVLNPRYSVAHGRDSQDIVPTMVFDDGRFTYLSFPGNREVPAVFQVLADGSETLLNTRMEQDALVVDRVARQLVLRAGGAVVSIRNDGFDADGVPPEDGTTVPGVQRVVRGAPGAAPAVVPTRPMAAPIASGAPR